MRLIEYADREMLFLSLANQIAGELGQTLRSSGRASLVVPGGTTPGPLFDLLADVDLDWEKVTVLLTDERWVPESDPRSNAALLRQRLLKGPAAAATFLPYYGADTEGLNEAILQNAPFTSLILGMGADMHTASLFPQSPDLAEALSPQAPPLLTQNSPDFDTPRITLTAPILRSAINIHVLILGTEKRQSLERAADLPPDTAPINIVLDTAAIHWSE